MAWGVVTNKPARFTDPLMPQIGLAHAGCMVSGDTVGVAKPHPAPLLEGRAPPGYVGDGACGSTVACWYVGDDLRDCRSRPRARAWTYPHGGLRCWGYCGEHQGKSEILAQGPAVLDLGPGAVRLAVFAARLEFASGHLL
jgi:phosphoglycolate phosphatase-like HAD superfamily hydrolase